jgi:hypothetical protein
LFQEFIAGWRRRLGPNDPHICHFLSGSGQFLLQYQQPAAAEPFLRESLTICQKHWPDHWMTFHIHTLVGASLLRQGKYAAAEPLLLQGYEGMQARENSMQQADREQILVALQHLIQLYQAWGRGEAAERYRALLAARLAQP